MVIKKAKFLSLGIFIVLFIIIVTPYLFKNGPEKHVPKVWKRTTGRVQSRDSGNTHNTDFVLQDDILPRQRPVSYNINQKYNNNTSDNVKVRSKVDLDQRRTSKALPLPQITASNIKNTKEVTHVEFLKVHKTASSTAQSIFLRFGLERNLSFVIPTPTHYVSVRKYFFSDVWPSLHGTLNTREELSENINSKYDMLTHHMVFNHRKVSQLLPSDAVYVAIVRDPFDLFVAAARYYKFAIKPYGYLDKLPNETFIIDLIRNPKQFEATTTSESMTYNSMAYDFGLNCLNTRKPEMCTDDIFAAFLNETRDTFDIVLVLERFDESLVLLRRKLNWSIKDILYANINKFSSDQFSNISQSFNISADDMKIFRERNKFDYGVYKLFKDRLEEQISNEKDFREEVAQFRIILRKVQNFCSSDKNTVSTSNNNDNEKKLFESNENAKLENNFSFKNIKLLKSIKLILKTKIVSRRQVEELFELFDSIESGATETTTVPLSKLLPLLFKDKVIKSSESKLFISGSKWNKDFYVTNRDCVLMSKEIMDLYEVVKNNHLNILVENKFGNSFSVHKAVEYLSTFT